jgi:hypothetical protein
MVAKFNSEKKSSMFFSTVQTFRPCLPSKLLKSANMTHKKFFFSKIQYGYQKKQILMLILNLLQKLQKTCAEKSCQQKSDRKIRIFDFYYCVQ